ncbi:FxsA family protein [Phyllobacterium chamaecytisi]|uniref:FxsA family protein n=1 Tax=Phyllobacterium chamaecytisi TaxID=2876082 RepID=UPI001CCA3402|nr:FxsA family protein [Phyllobacterium sp. KW56]MBZ9602247.1 membrane protein FxsA [Phyllobacterium sp. KW56]
MRSLVPLFVLALPFLEIAGFIVVGSKIGVLATLGLIILSIFVGVFLLRFQGLGLIQKIREETAAGRTPKRELVHGVMLVFAAFLLIIPGFITDIIGLLLFIPAVRDFGWRCISDRVVVVDSGQHRRGRPDTSRIKDQVIELDPEDYSSKPDPDSPWNPKP